MGELNTSGFPLFTDSRVARNEATMIANLPGACRVLYGNAFRALKNLSRVP